MNTPVSLEIDRLLIEKNIDMPVSPSIADVVMWLYKKCGIWISPTHQHNKFFWSFASYQTKEFNTPNDAYEAAIIYTLKNLI